MLHRYTTLSNRMPCHEVAENIYFYRLFIEVPYAEQRFFTRRMNLATSHTKQPSTRAVAQLGSTYEPEVKPKKVNSEVRKQQNRVASRNYRTSPNLSSRS